MQYQEQMIEINTVDEAPEVDGIGSTAICKGGVDSPGIEGPGFSFSTHLETSGSLILFCNTQNPT